MEGTIGWPPCIHTVVAFAVVCHPANLLSLSCILNVCTLVLISVPVGFASKAPIRVCDVSGCAGMCVCLVGVMLRVSHWMMPTGGSLQWGQYMTALAITTAPGITGAQMVSLWSS